MKENFSNKASRLLLGLIIFAMVASFVFSSFQSGLLQGPNVVATVNGLPIKSQEYRNAVSQQLKMYEQLMGGQGPQKQLIDMLKQNILGKLIQEKMFASYAKKLNLDTPHAQIRDEIKKMPYFLTNGRFDLNLYKQLLERNGLTPQEFEESMAQQLQLQGLEELLTNVPISQKYVQDLYRIKGVGLEVSLVKIQRDQLYKLISVSDKEIADYAFNKGNDADLEQLYRQDFSKYNKPVEIKVSHILLRKNPESSDEEIEKKALGLKSSITSATFGSQAKKLSEDPSTKDKGGELGWIKQGMFDPAFEKAAFDAKKGSVIGPVKSSFGQHFIFVQDRKEEFVQTLDQVKLELSKTLVQKKKTADLDKVFAEAQVALSKEMENVTEDKLNSIKNKYDAVTVSKTIVNKLDRRIGEVKLDGTQATTLFSKYSSQKVFLFPTPSEFIVVTVLSPEIKKNVALGETKDLASAQKLYFSQKLRVDLLEKLQKDSKVVTYKEAL